MRTIRVSFTIDFKHAEIAGDVYLALTPGTRDTYCTPGDPTEFQLENIDINYVEFDNGTLYEGELANQAWVKKLTRAWLDFDRIYQEADEILAERG